MRVADAEETARVIHRKIERRPLDVVVVIEVAAIGAEVRAARLVFSRTLDVRTLISHRFGLAETQAAVNLASQPTADSLKIFVKHDLK